MAIVLGIICIALRIYFIILLIRIILSWVPSLPEPVQPAASAIRRVTDPVLDPLRRLLPPLQTGAIAFDLSPIIAFFALYILTSIFC
jgi:YggT family protein